MQFKLFDSPDEIEKLLQNNQPRLVYAGGRNICIVRQGKNLIAFANECPHLGETLHKGWINNFDEIICPLHTYRFHLKSGEEAERRCSSLTFFEVLIDEGVFISI